MANHSEKTKKLIGEKAKMRFANKENHPMFNKTHSDESKKKISEANKGRFVGKNSPRYGKHHSEESKKLISIAASKRVGEKASMFGKHHSKKTIEKISKTRIKNGKSKGKNNSMYGKTHSKETRLTISIKLKERLKDKTKHSMWNPNITDEERINGRFYPEYDEWRRIVYERDNYTCQICGDSTGGNLIAHHLEGYANNPDLRTAVENGITLCKKCHKNFHHQYGYGNNTKKQFEEFINYD